MSNPAYMATLAQERSRADQGKELGPNYVRQLLEATEDPKCDSRSERKHGGVCEPVQLVSPRVEAQAPGACNNCGLGPVIQLKCKIICQNCGATQTCGDL